RDERCIACRDPGLLVLTRFRNRAGRIGFAQGPWQSARELGAVHRAHRRAIGQVLAFEITEEGPNRGDEALYAARAQSARAPLREKRANIGRLELLEHGQARTRPPMRGQESEKALDIVAVGPKRVWAHPALMLEAREPGFLQLGCGARHD